MNPSPLSFHETTITLPTIAHHWSLFLFTTQTLLPLYPIPRLLQSASSDSLRPLLHFRAHLLPHSSFCLTRVKWAKRIALNCFWRSNPFAALSLLYSYEHNSGRDGHDTDQPGHDHEEEEDSIPDLVELDASRVPIPDDGTSAEARMAIENIPYALPHGTPVDAQE